VIIIDLVIIAPNHDIIMIILIIYKSTIISSFTSVFSGAFLGPLVSQDGIDEAPGRNPGWISSRIGFLTSKNMGVFGNVEKNPRFYFFMVYEALAFWSNYNL